MKVESRGVDERRRQRVERGRRGRGNKVMESAEVSKCVEALRKLSCIR